MDLVGAAWMVREIDQAVSAIHLCEDGNLIVGGWDGLLTVWNLEGDLLWSANCGDRIESIYSKDNMIIATSGLSLVCLVNSTIEWTKPLEGSADLLCVTENEIYVTSSVYDIENQDFMEGAIWSFSFEGELNFVNRFDERPWFLSHIDDVIIGLGRPRCGYLQGTTHITLPTESPVTCGVKLGDKILFGHADGAISNHEGAVFSVEKATVESIIRSDDFVISILDNGAIVARGPSGNLVWESSGNQLTSHVFGFSSTYWAARYDGNHGYLEIRTKSGDLISEQTISKVNTMTSTTDRVAVGFEDGKIMVWENQLFMRRLKENGDVKSTENSALAARLRSLRK